MAGGLAVPAGLGASDAVPELRGPAAEGGGAGVGRVEPTVVAEGVGQTPHASHHFVFANLIFVSSSVVIVGILSCKSNSSG